MASISILSRSSSPSLDGEPERFCRACQSSKLYTDWAQGDRVCTNCGLVDEEKVVDDRPEWRDYDNDDDAGRPSRARSSLVPVDESKFLGGLQATKLSSHVYGQSSIRGSDGHQRLRAADRSINSAISKIHALAMMDEKVAMQIRRKRRLHEDDENDKLAPEYAGLLVAEAERTKKRHEKLHATDKWSLSRAIRLYGSAHEATMEGDRDVYNCTEDLVCLSEDVRKAAKDLYAAYSMLFAAARRLQLPVQVSRDATATLCRYARRRNGLNVRGVASTLKKKGDNRHVSPEKEKAARKALRNYNTMKQIGALCTGILFYTARSHNTPRQLQEVCESMEPHELSRGSLDTKGEQFIKKKHASKAFAELKEYLPNFVSNQCHAFESAAGEGPSAMLESFAQKMRLPLVAQAATRVVLAKFASSDEARTRAPLLCASLLFFVCKAGHLMEGLAYQADATAHQPSKKPKLSTENFDAVDSEAATVAASERQAYEMRRLWDAWRDQTPWHRSLNDIERTCGVPRSTILDHFKEKVFPVRKELLSLLQVGSANETNASGPAAQALKETPLAEILLSKVDVVAVLMKPDDRR